MTVVVAEKAHLPCALSILTSLEVAMRGDMMLGIGELSLAQQDGSLPTPFAAGSAPGESGLSVYGLEFRGGAHVSARAGRHQIWFVSRVRIACRMADRTLRHDAPARSLAIYPAGTDCAADAEESVHALIVTIDPSQLALAAAEGSALDARLIERLMGYDQALLDLARSLASQAAGNPNGSLYWNEAPSGFIDGLAARHTSLSNKPARGMLGKEMLERIREYVVAHFHEPIEVATLARMAGRSLFHFSRIFSRSVGMTPHRYIVHLRLQRAIELVPNGRSGLAEIAARTGAPDQGHLSRWVRRVHGVSLTQLAP